jgi:hypothetical protein
MIGAGEASVEYRIAIIGPDATSIATRLLDRVRKQLDSLGNGILTSLVVLNSFQTSRADSKHPIVGVYIGPGTPSPDDLSAIRHLQDLSAPILPIVTDVARFLLEVPDLLHAINGSSVREDPSLDRAANVVLENLGLLRKNRRLFISYRRVESADAAIQLRHELDARGFDVFLDTHSVPKGDAFQEVLWQRLADSDVVVMLDSPGFIDSVWTREEVAQAHAMTIGILQIVWPGKSPAAYTDLCERLYLQEPQDIHSGRLDANALQAIGTAVERLRARSLAARHDNIVKEFCDAAAGIGIPATVQPYRYISVQTTAGEIFAIPAVGVPDANRYHQASVMLADRSAAGILLLYDQRGLRPAWCDFLRWLDDFLPVKAVPITSVAAKLSGL